MRVEYCNYDLVRQHIAEALVIAGLAKDTSIDHLAGDVKAVERYLAGRPLVLNEEQAERLSRHLDRGKKLGSAKPGSGHDCFLKGIVVTAVISAPAYQWPQIQRYHFQDIITSQSKMHRITRFNIEEICNAEVDPEIITIVNKYILKYNQTQEKVEALTNPEEVRKAQEVVDWYFRKIINNAPQGLRLAAGIVTNYLQLKTQFFQRKNHKLTEWNTEFINWLKELPYFFEYIGVDRNTLD